MVVTSYVKNQRLSLDQNTGFMTDENERNKTEPPHLPVQRITLMADVRSRKSASVPGDKGHFGNVQKLYQNFALCHSSLDRRRTQDLLLA